MDVAYVAYVGNMYSRTCNAVWGMDVGLNSGKTIANLVPHIDELENYIQSITTEEENNLLLISADLWRKMNDMCTIIFGTTISLLFFWDKTNRNRKEKKSKRHIVSKNERDVPKLVTKLFYKYHLISFL